MFQVCTCTDRQTPSHSNVHSAIIDIASTRLGKSLETLNRHTQSETSPSPFRMAPQCPRSAQNLGGNTCRQSSWYFQVHGTTVLSLSTCFEHRTWRLKRLLPHRLGKDCPATICSSQFLLNDVFATPPSQFRGLTPSHASLPLFYKISLLIH